VKPKTPPRLGPAGRRVWQAFVGPYEFDDHELILLQAAARQADLAADLEALIAADGLTVVGSAGQVRLHPAVAEVRAGRLALGRLLAQLSLPEGAEPIRSDASLRGRRAAEVRWTAERARRTGGQAS
jgi:hypothetical protein